MAAENVGVLANWIDRVIGKILKVRDHKKLAQTAKSIRERVDDM